MIDPMILECGGKLSAPRRFPFCRLPSIAREQGGNGDCVAHDVCSGLNKELTDAAEPHLVQPRVRHRLLYQNEAKPRSHP